MTASVFDAQMALVTPTYLALFGINITVDNSGAGSGARTIKAIISTPFDLNIREGSTSLQSRSKTIEISARNDTEGVITPKVRGNANDLGGMTVILPDEPAVTWYVMDIQQTDAGMHTLEISDNPGV